MRREDIPARLRVARPDDCKRIPAAALKSMTPAGVVSRLAAASEFRRRARVPHLDGDLYRYRIGQAGEVLATTDLKRAAELIKAAGVTTAAPARRPALPGDLRKAAAGPAGGQRISSRSATVPTPALDAMGQAPSLTEGLTSAIQKGHLGAVQKELGLIAAAHAELSGTSRAAHYERQAARVTSPADRRAYEELAKQERARVSAL